MFQRAEDPRYRFNPFYRNHFKQGQFVSNPNATLPKPDLGLHIGLYDGSLNGFDWLGEENNTSFTYSEDELDRMIAELNAKGYGQEDGIGAASSIGGQAISNISYEFPGRSIGMNIWRSHTKF